MMFTIVKIYKKEAKNGFTNVLSKCVTQVKRLLGKKHIL